MQEVKGTILHRPGLWHQCHLQWLQVHKVDAIRLHRVCLLFPRTIWQLLRSRLQEQVSSQGKQSQAAAWGAVPRGQRFHRQAIPLALSEHNVLPGGGHGQWLQEEGLGCRYIAFKKDLVPVILYVTRRELHRFNGPTYCSRISYYGLTQCCAHEKVMAACMACVIHVCYGRSANQ